MRDFIEAPCDWFIVDETLRSDGKDIGKSGLDVNMFYPPDVASVMGLIHDIPTVRELTERIVREAEAIIRGRLSVVLS